MLSSRHAVDLLLCVATELEGALLRERLDRTQSDAGDRSHRRRAGQRRARRDAVSRADGRAGDRGLRRRWRLPSSGLQVGDVVCAESECYGDLGATSPSGFLDMKALGFPVVEAPAPLFNEIPMQVFPVAAPSSVRHDDVLHRHRWRRRARSKQEPAVPWRAWRARRSPTSRICTASGRRSARHQQHRDGSRHQRPGDSKRRPWRPRRKLSSWIARR